MDRQDNTQINWPKILLIGDSLTQLGYSDSGKWVALLADLFQRKCDVINRGFSGYTTRSIKPFIPNVLFRLAHTKAIFMYFVSILCHVLA